MKLLIHIAFALAALFIPHAVCATAQFPDKIFYEGQELSLYANPLEQFFVQGHEKPDVLRGGVLSTACWRGYVATWEILDKKLYLKKIEKEFESIGPDNSLQVRWREIPLSEIFPESSGPVHAAWYSGVLRIPKGKMLRYVHMGYDSLFEKDLLIKIVQGAVEKVYEVDNRE